MSTYEVFHIVVGLAERRHIHRIVAGAANCESASCSRSSRLDILLGSIRKVVEGVVVVDIRSQVGKEEVRSHEIYALVSIYVSQMVEPRNTDCNMAGESTVVVEVLHNLRYIQILDILTCLLP